MKTIARVLVVGAALALLLGSSGCYRVKLEERPPMRTYSMEVSETPQSATKAEVDISVGVGELELSVDASGTDLLAGTVRYAPDTWRPVVKYDVDAEHTGRLIMRQPSTSEVPAFRTTRNEWDLRLGRPVPVDLRMQLGVGRSRIDLTGADLTYLDVLTGVGESVVTLPTPRTGETLACRVEAGVGELTLRVPEGVGVRIRGTQDGLGGFHADGFTSQGDLMTNKAYDEGARTRLDIDLQRGVGDVRIETVRP